VLEVSGSHEYVLEVSGSHEFVLELSGSHEYVLEVSGSHEYVLEVSILSLFFFTIFQLYFGIILTFVLLFFTLFL
jgi:hypothetical protein